LVRLEKTIDNLPSSVGNSVATIALDATYTVDPQPSGVSIYSRKLIESLAALDTAHRFLLCYRLSRFSRWRDFLRPAAAPGRRPTFSVRFFQEPLTFWLPWQARLFHSLAQRPPAFRFAREIVTVNDVFPLTGRDYSTPDFQKKFSGLLLEAVERAARVLAPSQYTADQLVRHAGVAREKISVIPYGAEPPGKALTAEERLGEREHLVGKGKEMVLSVGVMQTRKNTINALRALASLPARFRLVLAGGEGHGSGAIRDFIRKEGLESRVILLGYVAADRLPSLYQAATVLLFPSLEEGFGLPVLEAMAHGLPVVTSNTSSLPEVGGDAALYADPHEPRQLAAQVERAAEDRPLRESMIARGLARAREFTWRRTAEETCRVYEELVVA
jgi:glycosyltransferase involved in cell wall biosynthesis